MAGYIGKNVQVASTSSTAEGRDLMEAQSVAEQRTLLDVDSKAEVDAKDAVLQANIDTKVAATSGQALAASNAVEVVGTTLTVRKGDGTQTDVALPEVTSASVGAASAGLAVGSVGSYAFLSHTTNSNYGPGATLGGGSLRYSSARDYNNTTGGGIAGTWRCMGYGYSDYYGKGYNHLATLWLRII